MMNKVKLEIFQFSIGTVPWKDIGCENSNQIQFCYAAFLDLNKNFNLSGLGDILWVYNYFTTDVTFEREKILSSDKLFGSVLCVKPRIRGVFAWKKLFQVEIESSVEMLPHFRLGDAFYMKNGNYSAMEGIRSSKEKIIHLEKPWIWVDENIKLRTTIEIIKNGFVSVTHQFSIEEWKEIIYILLRSNPSYLDDSDEKLRAIVSFYIANATSPIFASIPIEYRERVKEE
jgi:hypothetical protein